MWTPLQLRSHFSFGEGSASPDEIVARAVRDGLGAVALTDVENVYGQIRFHTLCRRAGIRPVTGVVLRGASGADAGGGGPVRVVALARERTGWENLSGTLTERRAGGGESAGVARAPERTRRTDPVFALRGRAAGLFLLTGDPPTAERLLNLDGVGRDAVRLLLRRPGGRVAEGDLRRAARRLGLRVVADPDIRYLDPHDRGFHLFRRAVHRGRSVEAVAAAAPERGRHLPDPGEVRRRYADVPEAVEETRRVAGRCELDLLREEPLLPVPRGMTAREAHGRLAALSAERLDRARADGRCEGARYERRLQTELETIAARGMAGYFLIVRRVVEVARDRGTEVAARGSAVGSLVGHLLGVSAVDPVARGLHFERFVHRRRSDLPDIDLDVSSLRRDDLIRRIRDDYGPRRAAMASAHHRFRRRSAWRRGLGALGVAADRIDRICEALPPGELVREGAGDGPRPAARPPDRLLNPLPAGAVQWIERLIGRPRHIAVHPGGLVLAPDRLDRQVPLEAAPKGVDVTQFDADGLEAAGLVKLDLLGNRGLAEMEVALSHLRERHGGTPALRAAVRDGLSAIPLDDARTLETLDRADTVGCGQIETPAVRSVLERIPVRGLDDLIAALAIVRPGAASGEAKERFIRRARGEEPPEPLHPLLEEKLSGTYGLLLYEEDIMRALSAVGGIDLEEADELRRAVLRLQDRADGLASLRERFVQSAAENGVVPGRAQAIWEEVVRFASYSFNRAHAASYATLAFQTAFFRTHAPAAFACGVLDHHGGAYPLRTVAAQVGRWGVEVLPPHVDRSVAATVPVGDTPGGGSVRLGLSRVKHLTEGTGRRILESRTAAGRFGDLQGLITRTSPSRRELRALVLAGGCDGLAPLARDLYPLAHEAVLRALREGQRIPTARSLRRRLGRALEDEDPERLRRYRSLVRIRNELRFLEMHPSAHPMAVLREDARKMGCATTLEAAERAGERVRVAALLAASRRVATAGAGAMRFLTLEDERGLLESVLLPPAYAALDERITTPGPYLIEGRMRDRSGHVHLEIDRMVPFHRRLEGETGNRRAPES